MNIILKEGDTIDYYYQDIYINYEIKGEGPPIIFLHGWGQSKETFYNIANQLLNYKCYLIDLIGFGNSTEPYTPFDLNDYVLFLNQFISDLNIQNPIIIGHSFGGRIAVKYASTNNNIKSLILINSAGLRKKSVKRSLLTLKYKIKKKYYKLTKNIIKYNQLINTSGSKDYQSSSIIMKQTLSKIVKEDLTKNLKQINTKTLIIWGINDTITPYKDAVKMYKYIENSILKAYETDHFSYINKEKEIIKDIKEFIGE